MYELQTVWVRGKFTKKNNFDLATQDCTCNGFYISFGFAEYMLKKVLTWKLNKPYRITTSAFETVDIGVLSQFNSIAGNAPPVASGHHLMMHYWNCQISASGQFVNNLV